MVFLPGSVQYKSYLYSEIKKRDDSPLIYKVDKETYWGNDSSRNMHQTIVDLPLGLDVIEAWFDSAESIGMADEYDLYSDDVKLVELEGLGFGKFYCVAFARAINWTWGEITKYKLASDTKSVVESLNPVESKLERLGKYFNKREHYTALYGYPKRNLWGIFSQRSVSTQDSTFKPFSAIANLTVRQICYDLRDYAFFAMDRMNVSETSQLQIGIDPILFAKLSEPYITANNEERGTGVSYLRELGITFTVYNELKGENLNKYVLNEAGNGMYDPAFNRIVFKASTYTPEKHIFARKLFEPFQKSTMRYEQVAVSATTGVMFRDSNKIWYLDYSNTKV